MPETSPSEERLQSLRHRWTLDKTPRVLLQLADEYRKLDRAEEAIPLLEEGLVEHPGHLSFQIALGRCRLEMGDATAAIAILEEVTERDTTQLVANKTLLKAYVHAGNLGKARERLLHYSLLASGDPDLEALEEAVASLDEKDPGSGTTQAALGAPPSAEPRESDDLEVIEDEPVQESSPPSSVEAIDMQDPFGSLLSGRSAGGAAGDGEIFGLPPRDDDETPVPEDIVPVPEPLSAESEEADSGVEIVESAFADPPAALAPLGDPFGYVGGDSEQWNRAIEDEGIFALGLRDAVPDSVVEEGSGSSEAIAHLSDTDSAEHLLEDEDAQRGEPAPAPDLSSDREAILEIDDSELPEQAEPEIDTPVEPAFDAEAQSLAVSDSADSSGQDADSEGHLEAPAMAAYEAVIESSLPDQEKELPEADQDFADSSIAAEVPDELTERSEHPEGIEEVAVEVRSEVSVAQEFAPESTESPVGEVSSTLGALYLKQGHYGEARDIYSVLAQNGPAGSAAARRLELLRPVPDHALTAGELLAGDEGQGSSEPKQRLIHAYLKQLRKKVPRRVP